MLRLHAQTRSRPVISPKLKIATVLSLVKRLAIGLDINCSIFIKGNGKRRLALA
jgi:altronate dehydratase